MANYYIHKNNNISIIKGDTFDFNLFIEDDELTSETGTQYYQLKGDDVLYFRVCTPNSNHAVIEKEYYSGEDYCVHDTVLDVDYIKIRIDHEDTEDLPRGLYYYDAKLHIDHYVEPESSESSEGTYVDKWITIIQKTKFNIEE